MNPSDTSPHKSPDLGGSVLDDKDSCKLGIEIHKVRMITYDSYLPRCMFYASNIYY